MAAEVAGEPGECVGRGGCHVGIDGDHDQQRAGGSLAALRMVAMAERTTWSL